MNKSRFLVSRRSTENALHAFHPKQAKPLCGRRIRPPQVTIEIDVPENFLDTWDSRYPGIKVGMEQFRMCGSCWIINQKSLREREFLKRVV